MPSAFGYSGVELFLVISGFLIHLGFLKSNSNLNLFKFFNKRFWRIYPPYLVALICFGIIVQPTWENFFFHVFSVHNLSEKYFFGVNASFWSLALELQLYLIYPLFIIIRKKAGANNSYLIVLLISLSFTLVEILRNDTSLVMGQFVFKNWAVWIAGAYLAEKYHKNERVAEVKFIYFPLMLIGIMTFKIFWLHHYITQFLFAGFYLLLLDRALNNEAKKVSMSKMLNLAMFKVGLLSYSIYLFHQPILNKLLPIWSKLGLVHVGVLVTFLGVYAISFFTYKYLEIPSVRFGSIFYQRLFVTKISRKKGTENLQLLSNGKS